MCWDLWGIKRIEWWAHNGEAEPELGCCFQGGREDEGCRSQAPFPSSPPSALNDLRWGVYEELGLQGEKSRDGELRTVSSSLHKPVHSKDGPFHLLFQWLISTFSMIRIQFWPDVMEGAVCFVRQTEGRAGWFFLFVGVNLDWTVRSPLLQHSVIVANDKYACTDIMVLSDHPAQLLLPLVPPHCVSIIQSSVNRTKTWVIVLEQKNCLTFRV